MFVLVGNYSPIGEHQMGRFELDSQQMQESKSVEVFHIAELNRSELTRGLEVQKNQ